MEEITWIVSKGVFTCIVIGTMSALFLSIVFMAILFLKENSQGRIWK